VSEQIYDDRIDVDTHLSTRDVFGILKRSFTYVWPVKGLFFLKFFLMLGSLTPALVAPWPLKIMIDHVVLRVPLADSTSRFPPFIQPFVDLMATADPAQLLFATLVFLVLLLVAFGAGVGDRENYAFLAQGQDVATRSENMTSAGWSIAGGLWGLADLLCNIRLVQRVTNGLRMHLFRHLVRLPMSVLDDQRIGDGVYRTMYDAPSVQGVCFDLTIGPSISIFATLAALYIMQYSFGAVLPELVWLGMAVMPLSLAFTVPLARRARRASQASRGSGSATTNRIEENVSNVAAVQSHGREAEGGASFAAASAESFRQFRRVVAVNIGIEVAAGLALGILALWVFVLVTDRIIAAEMSPGDFLVVFTLFFTIAGVSLTLGRTWVDLQGNAAGVRRALFYIDLPNEEIVAGGKAVEGVRDGIEFSDVSLIYPDGREALVDANFKAEVGKTVALVGPTGAGKTSLAYLIPRFLQPTSGTVHIDGHDVRQFDVGDLRKHITYVFQEHYLLADTVANNVRLGRPGATDEDVRRVCEISGASEFIDRLPNGYATRLGRDGGTLSVGQKQRLSIARGLLRETPVLILDEPTAALDPDTERDLMAALDAVKAERIVIVIAHRLSTIRSADKILFMQDGQIVEQGSHAELMAISDGHYRRFVALQLGEDPA
jgi:ABC-type multidrug transport system fused ATPase/permease subunit